MKPVSRTYARWDAAKQAQAEVARACGATLKEISSALGVGLETVRVHLKTGEMERQRETRRRNYNPETNRERCRRYREANPDKYKERNRLYYETNREACIEKARHWREANPDRRRAITRRWRESNPELARASRRRWREANRERARGLSQAWRKANPERVRENGRRWREANRERARVKSRNWQKANPERARENWRRWHEANPERVREYGRRWQKANPEIVREKVRRQKSIRRAAHRRALVPLNRQRLLQRYALFGNRCAYCGDAGKMTADHVLALTKGGLDEPSNIVPACINCNCSKNNSPVESWYLRQPFFSEARWRKIQRHCQGIAQGQMSLALPPPDGACSITTGRLPATAIAGT